MTSTVLVDELAARIRAQILEGQIKLGERLQQAALARDLEVSRTPVREALRKLETEGMVELIPNRGAIVRGPTARELREAYEVRAELEGMASERAAEWISGEQLVQLARASERFEEFAERTAASDNARQADLAEWTEANNLFHEVIQEAAGNGQLQRMIRLLHHSFPRNLTAQALGRDTRLLRQNALEHRDILQAIEAGDGDRARLTMREHVQRSGMIVQKWFERYSDEVVSRR